MAFLLPSASVFFVLMMMTTQYAISVNAEATNEEHHSVVKRAIVYGRVAFSAYLSSRTTYLDNEKIVFDSEVINDGEAYDKSSGIFTVPATGTYLFAFQFEDWSNTDQQTAYLMVNGNIISSAIIKTLGRSTQAGNTVIVHLHKNDNVYVQVNLGQVYGSPTERYTTFSGYLLY
ncbi:complement C1q-like protein 4 [Ruditapes philippinarum]|uniref:complement C1q-like protein 4 n=1 Tax=Ruditapes philippinarum TaxID=129788 RepID=UPI00295AE4EE|nr:complement C1q-like protein 4 [Ruditapes philippinarum]